MSKAFPTGAYVKVVDFNSAESLSAAVAGQDAVIDTTFSLDVETPLRLIDAAVHSGVYRLFVRPSISNNFDWLTPSFHKPVSPATLGSILTYQVSMICPFSVERRLPMRS
jgi:hypothetical protein